MKDIVGETVGTLVSYLKGGLLLFKNYINLLTDTFGLLNNIMMLVTNLELCDYMKLIHYKRKKNKTKGVMTSSPT